MAEGESDDVADSMSKQEGGMKMTTFPIGFHNFHSDTGVNFQLNRWYSLGSIDYDTLMEIGKATTDFSSWVDTFTRYGERFHRQGDYIAAATCFRAAQFYTLGDERNADGQLKKISAYERCMAEYDIAYGDLSIAYQRVPYGDKYFPVLYLKHEGTSKGNVVIHGGYDSFIQEFVPYIQYIYEHGYDVYMFEGFGQGEVLNRCGMKMRPEWEECTSPILDYFELEDVTLIGISLGGYLAARAAWKEERIRRVVLYDLIYDFYGSLLAKIPVPIRQCIDYLTGKPDSRAWKLIEKKLFANLFCNWLFHQGSYIYGNINSFCDYFNCIKAYNTRTISPQLKQDVLVLAGADDIYTVFYEEQMRALYEAHSKEGRIFTREESASHHCQIGNLALALDYIIGWIDRVTA